MLLIDTLTNIDVGVYNVQYIKITIYYQIPVQELQRQRQIFDNIHTCLDWIMDIVLYTCTVSRSYDSDSA